MINNKPIVHLYTINYNEALLLPYFFRHYGNFVDKFIIYDNYSTDESETVIRSFATQKEIIINKYNTQNLIRDDIYLKIKNNEWKASRNIADFVIICDIDEFLYHPRIIELLIYLKEKKYSIIKPCGYNMVSTILPSTPTQIYDEITKGVKDKNSSKAVLFNPNLITEINYAEGCHYCKPKGKIKEYKNDNHLKLLHFKWINLPYVIKKHTEYAKRLSPLNIKKKWGWHYAQSEEKMKAYMQKLLDSSDIIIKENNNTDIIPKPNFRHLIRIMIEKGLKIFTRAVQKSQNP